MRFAGWFGAALVVVAAALIGCSSQPEADVPVPPAAAQVVEAAAPAVVTSTRPAAVEAVSPVETATPEEVVEPLAVDEPIAVSQPPTPTAVPTAVTEAEASLSAVSAGPAPSETIPGLIGPSDYPEDVNPLTGEQVSDPAILDRRPLAIKISNYPPTVRPQSGIGNADIIFEHYAEGVTRFTAIFYSRDADPVGSVRSGRLIDLEIPVMFDAAFGYSGSSGPVRQMFRESAFFDRIVSPDFAHGGYYRVENPGGAIEHTMFTSTYNLRYILQERGQETRPSYERGWAFHPDPPAGGSPASSLEVQYRTTNAFWQYYPNSQRFARWTDGEMHVDANTGTQLSFRNVLVLGAHHEDTDILEDLVGGGHYSIQIQIWGEGPVSLFRDGQRFDGVWRRERPEDMITFYDLEGNILPLAPGNSFIQVVPLGFTGLFVTP